MTFRPLRIHRPGAVLILAMSTERSKVQTCHLHAYIHYLYYIRLYVRGGTCPYGIAVSHLPFWGMYFWRLPNGTGAGQAYFWRTEVQRQLKLNVTLLIIKAKLHLLPLPFLQLRHSNYYTACNFNRIYSLPVTAVYAYPSYLPTYQHSQCNDHGRQ